MGEAVWHWHRLDRSEVHCECQDIFEPGMNIHRQSLHSSNLARLSRGIIRPYQDRARCGRGALEIRVGTGHALHLTRFRGSGRIAADRPVTFDQTHVLLPDKFGQLVISNHSSRSLRRRRDASAISSTMLADKAHDFDRRRLSVQRFRAESAPEHGQLTSCNRDPHAKVSMPECKFASSYRR